MPEPSKRLKQVLKLLLRDGLFYKPRGWDEVVSEAMKYGVGLQSEHARGEGKRYYFIERNESVDRARAIIMASDVIAGSGVVQGITGYICPYCGGNSGYIVVFWTRYSQLNSWRGVPLDAESVDSKGGAIGECADCHRRFNVSKFIANQEAIMSVRAGGRDVNSNVS